MSFHSPIPTFLSPGIGLSLLFVVQIFYTNPEGECAAWLVAGAGDAHSLKEACFGSPIGP